MSEILQTQDTVKLFEYEQYKPELCEEVLAHHGILGMHWGKRNGPPYPLDSDKSTGKRLKETIGGAIKKHKKKKALKKARATKLKNQQLKKEQEKLKKSKEEVIKANDIKSMLNDIGNYTNDEINKVLNRLDTEKRLRERVAQYEYENMPKLKKIRKTITKNLKEGMAEGGKSALRTVGKNAVKKGLKEGLKALAPEDGEIINKQIIEELFKEKNKK